MLDIEEVSERLKRSLGLFVMAEVPRTVGILGDVRSILPLSSDKCPYCMDENCLMCEYGKVHGLCCETLGNFYDKFYAQAQIDFTLKAGSGRFGVEPFDVSDALRLIKVYPIKSLHDGLKLKGKIFKKIIQWYRANTECDLRRLGCLEYMIAEYLRME